MSPYWAWLADDTIRAAVIVSGLASALFFWRVLTYRQPIVDLRALPIATSRSARSIPSLSATGCY
jgi:hypothetical protein